MAEQVHADTPTVGERASEVRDQLRDRAQETNHVVREFAMEHPFLAVGGALAAGFFLARLIAKR